MKKLLLTSMVIGIALMTGTASAVLMDLGNSGFEVDAVPANGETTTADSWASNGVRVANVTSAPWFWGYGGATLPAPHSGDQIAMLEGATGGGWKEINQTVKEPGTSTVHKVAANETYNISVWVGRMAYASQVAPQLEVRFVVDGGTYDTVVTSGIQDLSSMNPGDPMVELTYTFETGADPVGLGEDLILQIINWNDYGAAGFEEWQARVMLDDISVTLEVPLPGTPILYDDLGTVTVAQGGEVTFEVTTNGEEELLQWYFNDSPLFNENSNSLTITNVTIDDEGSYHCVASKAGFDDVVSGTAELLTERLFAHWEFDGDLTDSVQDTVADAQIHDAVSMDGDPNFAAGHVGSGALAFIDTGAEIIDRTDFDFFSRGYTISCWGKIDETDTPTEGPYYIVSFGDYPLFGNLGIVLENDQDFTEDPYSNEPGGSLDSDMPNTGQWQYMAVTCDAVEGVAVIKLYVDGELTDRVEGVSAIEHLDYLRFGWYASGHGRQTAVDNVKIHTYALDATEIATEYITDDPGSSVACAERPAFDVAPVDALDCVVDLLDFAEFAKGWLDDGNVYDD